MAKDHKPASFSWEAPEFPYYHKEVGWYWISILLAAILVVLALWQKNFLFAVFVIIAELLIVSWGSRYPRAVRFEIDERGIGIEDKPPYRYAEIEHYAINPEGDLSELILTFKARLSPATVIHFHTRDTGRIREFLRGRLREVHHDDGIVEALLKLIRF